MEPQTFATRRVDRAERISAWEAHHARALVGLSCEGPRSGAFDATVTSARLGPYDLAHVVATPHAVRRTRAHIGTHEAPGRVIYLTRRGEARLVRAGGTVRHGPGSAVVCAVDEPFDREFRDGVDELVLKFSDAEAERLLPDGAVALDPVPTTGSSRVLISSVHRFVRAGLRSSAGSADDLALRLRLLFTPGLVATAEGRRTLVLDIVDEHLHDPALSTGVIAARLGLTDRTLRRLFATTDRSLTEEIRARRLRRALHLLQGTSAIGDIAARCGFASHAHFSRLFRAEYGCSPSEVRSAPTV